MPRVATVVPFVAASIPLTFAFSAPGPPGCGRPPIGHVAFTLRPPRAGSAGRTPLQPQPRAHEHRLGHRPCALAATFKREARRGTDARATPPVTAFFALRKVNASRRGAAWTLGLGAHGLAGAVAGPGKGARRRAVTTILKTHT